MKHTAGQSLNNDVAAQFCWPHLNTQNPDALLKKNNKKKRRKRTHIVSLSFGLMCIKMFNRPA